MKTSNEIFLSMFTDIDSAEDCPYGTDLLLWDGCDFNIDYVDVDVDTGTSYFANGSQAIAYLELPQQELTAALLGDGE
jgi:hypothetical protein